MRLINGIEDGGVASVILVLETVRVQVERNVVNIGHGQRDLTDRTRCLKCSGSHLVEGFLHRCTINTLVCRTSKGTNQCGFNVGIILSEKIHNALHKQLRLCSVTAINLPG